MTTFCQTYYSVRARLCPLLEALTKPQRENLCLLIFGLFAAGSAQLTRIGVHLPLRGGVASAVQRMERLIKNRSVVPERVYRSVAKWLLCCFRGSTVRLILDATQVNGRVFVLFVALAYRGRALPLAWRMLRKQSVSSEFAEQKQLLDGVAALVPAATEVVLLGDREFGTRALLCYCQRHNWRFCLRAKKNRLLL